jgi:Uma2 family endonuclease
MLHTDAYVLIHEHDDVWLCPDLVMSCNPQDMMQPRNILSPSLIIEVLSPGTANDDRGEKAELYRGLPTLQEYLLIDSQRIYAELYRREAEKLWTFHVFFQEDTIELRTAGIRLPMDRLYLKTSLNTERKDGPPAS